MTQATKDDINRVYDKLEPMARSITQIETKLEMMVIPKQPCVFLETHLEEHKDTQKTWKSSFTRAVVDVIKMGVVAIITWFFVKK